MQYINQLSGAWESFFIKPQQGSLLVLGSDVRGTVFAIFDLAEQLGVSPWKWWADVVNLKQHQAVLNFPKNGVYSTPSVQYRGIFLNDEDWGLQPWAAKTFEKDIKDIGPKTYEKIFQLLLRLKANTEWPAMHPSTKAFYKIKGNQEMAQQYHIVIGTSHAEPILRNNVDEWDKKKQGPYNYVDNSEQINHYWQDRVNQVKGDKNHNLFTIGMRGVHDSHMEGVNSTEQAINLLHSIIRTQRNMLSNTFAREASQIPQVFIPYKEVLELYNNGLKVPDDVTIMWTDDNYGYIRRLSDKQEQMRTGGSGIYYHLSYWGRPHDYLWLSTTQPALIWYEMSKAYQDGAQKMWIANVGDIKPAEYNMELFLDLAWNVEAVNHDSIKNHLTQWASREFGAEIATDVSRVMNEYYRLAFIRKPEFMGWSQTEPTTDTQLTEFTDEEAQQRISAYAKLINIIKILKNKVPKSRQDAWFQLIEYPIKAAAHMNEKFLYRQLSEHCLLLDCKKSYQQLSVKAYQAIKELTNKYNLTLSQGKWQHMMSMKPRNLPVFQAPEFNTSSEKSKIDHKREQPLISLKASQYSRSFIPSNSSSKTRWHAIEGFGHSDNAVTIFPSEYHSVTNNKVSLSDENNPWLEYQITLPHAGKYEIELHFIPTHTNQYNDQVNLAFNGKYSGSAMLNTKGRSEQWKTNVLRNSQIKTFKVSVKQAGLQRLRLAMNQTGIVLDQIAVYRENSLKPYVINH